MEKNTIKKFELNKNVLKDFDSLMSKNLGEIEELTITEVDSNSKILNIISLCLNVKTITIDANPRVDTTAVLNNICKPDMVESIILRNVKIPSERIMKKFINLRLISLSEIRFNKVGDFLSSIVNPRKIEAISLLGVDFAGEDINILEKFSKVRYLTLKRLNNCRFAGLSFLKELSSLKRIILKDSIIRPEELNGLMKGKYEKDILLEIENGIDSTEKDYVEINDEEGIVVKVNTVSLDAIVNKVSFYKIDSLTLILDKVNNIDDYIKKLKKIKNRINLEVKDFSYISAEDAKILQEKLKINSINIIDTEGFLSYKNKDIKYSIEEYIEIREKLDEFVEKANQYAQDINKFLCAYKEIGLALEKDYNVEKSTSDVSDIRNLLNERKTFREGFAEVLQNVLLILKIESIFVKGRAYGEDHLWNQVLIDGIWYNVDLEADKDAICKRGIFRGRVNNCLISDEVFFKTHNHKDCEKNFAPKSFEIKYIRNFMKKENVLELNSEENDENSKEDISAEKIENKSSKSIFSIIEKIKNICLNNKVKTLPKATGKGNVENTEDKK